MDSRKYMIIDLEKKGDKRMFITEQVVHISENKKAAEIQRLPFS